MWGVGRVVLPVGSFLQVEWRKEEEREDERRCWKGLVSRNGEQERREWG